MKSKHLFPIIVGIIAVVIGFRYLPAKKAEVAPSTNSAPIEQTNPTVAVPESSALIAKITKTDAYHLFTVEKDPQYTQTFETIDDGLIKGGTYDGYHRLVVNYDEEGDGPGGGFAPFLFATKDYKTFIAGTALDTEIGYPNVKSAYNTGIFDKTKVVAASSFPINHPAQIKIDNFVLERENNISDNTNGMTELTSDQPGLKYFSSPESYNGQDTILKPLFKNYIQSNNHVFVQDSSGLAFRYTLSYKYKKSDLTEASIYKSYGDFLQGGCGGLGYTYVLKNISDNDLIRVASTLDGKVDLFTFKDPSSLFNQAEYQDKVTNEQYFTDDNKISPPSFADYVVKNPVLLFRDPWGRFVVLGETEYKMAGECGKPVIYLYPTKPTEVSVRFIKPTSFNTDIPIYHNGWKVWASPDGTLKDLQPEVTNCASIDYSRDGSAYAKDLCPKGVYPYLYWSGQAYNPYPKVSDGWIISSADLGSFITARLFDIGLNAKEAKDMTDFWIPEMQKKNTPYYRISFFQTKEMNNFIPMNVSPKPDTTIRVFLDWSPLAVRPAVYPMPEVLQKITRKGFTLVEWGGLKQ